MLNVCHTKCVSPTTSVNEKQNKETGISAVKIGVLPSSGWWTVIVSFPLYQSLGFCHWEGCKSRGCGERTEGTVVARSWNTYDLRRGLLVACQYFKSTTSDTSFWHPYVSENSFYFIPNTCLFARVVSSTDVSNTAVQAEVIQPLKMHRRMLHKETNDLIWWIGDVK